MFPSTCAYDPWGLFPWLGKEREILSLGCRFVDASPRQCGLLQYYSLTWTCFPSSGDLSALSALHMLSVPLNCSSQGFFSFFFHLWSQLPTLSSLVHCILLKLDWNHLTPCPPLANNAPKSNCKVRKTPCYILLVPENCITTNLKNCLNHIVVCLSFSAKHSPFAKQRFRVNRHWILKSYYSSSIISNQFILEVIRQGPYNLWNQTCE